MSRVGILIQYCSNEYRFLSRCIQEAKRVTEDVLITTCSHFFDGTPENRDLLNWTYASHPDVQFVEVSYNVKPLYTNHIPLDSIELRWGFYWHALLRHVGHLYMNPKLDGVLFLDADEIVVGEEFSRFIRSPRARSYQALRFASYFYDLRAHFRSTAVQVLPLFVRREALDALQLHNLYDRCGIFQRTQGATLHAVWSESGQPLFHHYPWTRSEAECRRKIDTWGHKHETNWGAILDQAFQEGTLQTSLFKEFPFESVEPFFDPLQVSIPEGAGPQGPFPNVKYVDAQQTHRRAIEILL